MGGKDGQEITKSQRIYFLNDPSNYKIIPAHPTVAAPAPINLAACSISRLAADVCRDWLAGTRAYRFVEG